MVVTVFYNSSDKKFVKHNSNIAINYVNCKQSKNKKLFDEFVFRDTNLPAYFFCGSDTLGDKTKYSCYGFYLNDKEVKDIAKQYNVQ